jgi:peroxiredoxin
MKMIRLLAVTVMVILGHAVFAAAGDEAQTTKVKAGDKAPDFTCLTLDGKEFTLNKQKGKVVVVNFFATWCGPCMVEMPHLEKEVYLRHKDRKDFALVVIGREHKASELEKFKKDKSFAVPIAPDPKREIYEKYAEKYIPRTFVIGRDGTVKLASVGYTEAEFKEMVKTIEAELGR